MEEDGKSTAAFCSSMPPKNNHYKHLTQRPAGNENNQNDTNTPSITASCAYNKPSSSRKRNDYLSWEDFFMAVASLSSQRSKDPVAPMGACIVNERKVVIGIGYNGFPRGCSDDFLPWKANSSDETSSLLSPSFFSVNAIINAILNKGSADVAGATLYTTSFPCHESAKIIIQSNIREVVYMAQDDTNSLGDQQHHVLPESDSLRASRIMLTMANVNVRKHLPTKASIQLNLTTKDTLQVETPSALQPSSTKPGSQPLDATVFRDLLIKEANYDPTQISSMKRLDYLSWDDYFMSVAFLTAQRSKDPNTQVGACIVDPQQRIVGLGYNGFPIGCSDDDLPWGRTGSSELDKKYAFVCHAEVNAILNKCSINVHGCKLYVALFPCNECAKLIIQSGIAKVLYLRDSYHDTDACRASRIMFQMAGVELVQLTPTQTTIDIHLLDKLTTGHNE